MEIFVILKIPQQKVIVVPQDMAMRYHTAGVMERNGAAEPCHVVSFYHVLPNFLRDPC